MVQPGPNAENLVYSYTKYMDSYTEGYVFVHGSHGAGGVTGAIICGKGVVSKSVMKICKRMPLCIVHKYKNRLYSKIQSKRSSYLRTTWFSLAGKGWGEYRIGHLLSYPNPMNRTRFFLVAGQALRVFSLRSYWPGSVDQNTPRLACAACIRTIMGVGFIHYIFSLDSPSN